MTVLRNYLPFSYLVNILTGLQQSCEYFLELAPFFYIITTGVSKFLKISIIVS